MSILSNACNTFWHVVCRACVGLSNKHETNFNKNFFSIFTHHHAMWFYWTSHCSLILRVIAVSRQSSAFLVASNDTEAFYKVARHPLKRNFYVFSSMIWWCVNANCDAGSLSPFPRYVFIYGLHPAVEQTQTKPFSDNPINQDYQRLPVFLL